MICVFVIVTLISFMLLPFSNSILHLTRMAVTPVLTYSVNVITRTKNFKDYFRTLDYYKKENIRLNARVSELERNLAEVFEYNEKISRLELLLDIKNKSEIAGYSVAAGRASVRNDGEFVINKGTQNGIMVGNAVVSYNGLVGCIAETSDEYSVIKTILNKNYEVCVRNVRNGISYVAYGDGNGMVLTDANSGVCDGDIIETSGADGLPEGIFIGEIQGVYEKFGNLQAFIKPSQNISEFSEVIVIVNE